MFTRKGQEKDPRSLAIETTEEERLRRDLEDEIRILHEQRNERIYELFEGRKLSADLTDHREVVMPKGETITREMLGSIEAKLLRKAQIAGSRVDAATEVKSYEDRTERQVKILSESTKRRLRSFVRATSFHRVVITMVRFSSR